ncbi:MAG TPA: VOC family protein [Mariprofundaceae bacterium]|nr:VOC family protein [Mariprofundaceae bacterium]
MHVEAIDHLVLTVRDIEKTCAFYLKVLAMKVIAFGKQKINLHQYGNGLSSKAWTTTPGSADLCLHPSLPMQEIIARLKAYDIEPLEGPVQRTGAKGPILSVYFRDSGHNLVEVSNPVGKSG